MRLASTGWMAFLILALALTGCGGKPKPSPYHAGNYPGTLKIGTPYEIDGRTYYPAHDPAYDEVGVASWYGPGFHGRSTANGERFDQHALTAAHRTLPLPSIVRVTNLENGKTAVVKVNDRGPFKKDRIIDLSKGTAEALGVIGNGTAKVRVQYLPVESRQLIAQLLESNQLKADSKTLAMLNMNQAPPPPAMSAAPPPSSMPPVQAPAMARSPISTIAGLAPVASRELSSPVRPTVPSRMLEAQISPETAASLTDAAEEKESFAQADLERKRERMPTFEPTVPESSPVPQAPPVSRAATIDFNQPETRRTPAAPVAETAPAPAVAPAELYVQAGSFSSAENAHGLANRLGEAGRVSVKPVDINGRTWYRVRVGPVANHAAAERVITQLQNNGIGDARIVRD